MKINTAQLTTRIQPLLRFFKRYAIFIFMIVLLGIFAFLVFRINHFSQVEPADDAVQEKLQTVQRPKVDQSVLDKIQQLQDQNIQVQSLFDKARSNPFNEQ